MAGERDADRGAGQDEGDGNDRAEDPAPDPFAELSLDDDFVNAAEVREESADDRLARLQRIDRQHRELHAERERERHHAARSGRRRLRSGRSGASRAPSGSRRTNWRVGIVVVVVLGLLIYVNYGRDRGSSSNRAANVPANLLGGDGDASSGSIRLEGGQPPAGVEEADAPRGQPALTTSVGPHAFIAEQPDGSGPVAYDPCRPIHYVINPDGEPADGANIVAAAVKKVSAATGLEFILDGGTDEVDSDQRASYQPDRYPDRWAPVLITWSQPGAAPKLAGDVAGYAGSSQLDLPEGSVFLSGHVVLDAPQLHAIEAEPGGPASVQAVVQHELGHLVGLNHVDDVTQLMNPVGSPDVTDFASGDVQGLALLGQGRCFPRI